MSCAKDDEEKPIKPIDMVKEYISQNPRLFVLYCIFSIGILINNIFIPRQYGSLISDIKDGNIKRSTIVYIIALMILSQVFIFANDIMEIKLYPSLHSYIRDISLKKIIENQSYNLSEMEAGKYVSRITRFQTIFTGLFDDFRNYVVLFSLVYIFAIGFAFKIDDILGLITCGMVGTVLYATYLNTTTCSKYSIERDNHHYRMVGGLDDIMSNITNVLNNNSYDFENKRLKNLESDIAHHSEKSLNCSYRYKLIVMSVLTVLIGLFVWRLMSLAQSNKTDTKTIISISIMMIYVFGIILKNISIFKDISYRYGTLTEILRTINARGHYSTVNKTGENKCSDCLLYISNLNVFSDDNSHHMIRDLNLKIMKGESISLTGEIGSGKSTLIKTLMKYRNNYTGEIYFNGIPYSNISGKDIRTHIYYVDQKCVLFNRSLYDNIVYGSSSLVSREQVVDIISKLGLSSFVSRFKNGLDTQCGVAGSSMSGGERQIIMLLRMYIRNPEIILLDEPTSAMDNDSKIYTSKLLYSLSQKCMKNAGCIICITHDKDLSVMFSRTIHMKDGKIVADIKN